MRNTAGGSSGASTNRAIPFPSEWETKTDRPTTDLPLPIQQGTESSKSSSTSSTPDSAPRDTPRSGRSS
ncbi:hypothetical protein BIW11_07710 [Tropilaelaps mercedesae]|uniref:Uncharacterized protein n=1 Tax=Tropilaelaps mercedesae TaxID=418985 RepID=A0A1V9XSS2_9ACAR|nr:hypothetical protein BIW11_07710 [Tropilaelaps mercedesae]